VVREQFVERSREPSSSLASRRSALFGTIISHGTRCAARHDSQPRACSSPRSRGRTVMRSFPSTRQAAQVGAVKALLRAAGLGRLSRSLGSEAGWARVIAAVRQHEELRTYAEQHRALWRCAWEQIRALDVSLARQQKESFAAQIARLQTIPGVGPIVASTAIAVFSTPERFPDAKHAASYAGLVPSTYQSGEHEAHGRITKRGSAELRAMLCEAAHHASRPDHPLNPYFARLCARRGYKMAIIAVAHRLCRIIFAMLRHQSDFDVAKLGVERGPFEHKIVRAYRLKASSQ